ncbi:hypothetical protein H9W95_06315 [Flavobacterium lindanitolerans]|nr:hypothetical protein [Flavobacterium lindanitolerans]
MKNSICSVFGDERYQLCATFCLYQREGNQRRSKRLQKDLASLQVGFKNQKKVTIISGISALYVQLLDANKKDIQSFFLQKDGYVAIEDFFKSNTPTTKYKVFGEGGFLSNGNTLDWILSAAVGQEAQKTIQVKIGLYVAEETGYRQYGQSVRLLEPMTFNVPIWDAKM